MFKYPLTRTELYENSAITISKDQFEKELNILLKENFVKEEAGFLLNYERDAGDIDKRIRGNKGAMDIMTTAFHYSKKVASYPFVEAVMLSGSLSKNYYDSKSDIDFFIVTKPGRLWICRTLLILRYKLLSKTRKKFWCTNYFISSDNLAIPDINAFTGTELAYLIPAVNYEAYCKLMEQNKWYKIRFPNKAVAGPKNCLQPSTGIVKRSVEKFLSGGFGRWLDNFLLNFTLGRWRRKYAALSEEDFDLQFRSRKDVCKRHTHGFQNKVLVSWEKKVNDFERKFNTRLAP